MPSRFHALTIATVVRVRDPKVTYPYCIECYSKLLINCHSRTWRCLRCKINYNRCNIPQRYRLSLEIADGSALCGATVFGKILEPYFGCSAEEIHCLLHSYDSNYIKNLLNGFFTGKSFLFGFKTLYPLEKSDFNMSLLSVLKSSCRKQCQTLPTDLIASQMINCNIGMACTLKILLTKNNNFKTQNTPPAPLEQFLQTPAALTLTESPLFIERTNSSSAFPLISQELIVLTCEMNPSGIQISRNLSGVLISSSGESETPNFINSCSQRNPSFHATKSQSTQTYKSFITNCFPDLSTEDISNHLLHSYKNVPSGSHANVKHLPEVSLANNPNEEILYYASDCEDVFFENNNSSDMGHKYSLAVPIPQKEYSTECSLNVNNYNNVSYAPESEDLEAFLNSFGNSPNEHFSEFQENTKLSQMHTTKSSEKQMCFLNSYNFKTTLKETSCSKSNPKMVTVAAVNKIRCEDICKSSRETGDWKIREINILSLLSFHSSTVTYFLLNLSVPYRFLKCIWESNCRVYDNPRYKNKDKSNRSNLFTGNLTCHSKLMIHNYNLNSWSEANQFCDIRNKIVTRQPITVNDDKYLLKSEDLYLSSSPAKIVTKTTVNNGNISNVYSKYPLKVSSTNEYLPKFQSAERHMSAVDVIKESSPKSNPSNSICNILPEDFSKIADMSSIPRDSCIDVSVISSFHINRMFSENESINGNMSTSASFKQLSPFQETIHPIRCLSKRLPNQDSCLESEPSFLNESKKRKKCNQCRSYLPRCLCNDFSENKENISYNGGKEALWFSKKLGNASLSESKQFVNKTLRPRNKNHHSVPTKGSQISSRIRKSQLSDLPFADGFHTFSTNVNLRKCHSFTSTPVPHFHIYQTSYRNLPHKDSSTEENIERLFPITPIKCSSENQKQSHPNSPSNNSVESHNSESYVLLPSGSLQQGCQESPKEEGNMSQDLFDPSTELFLSSPNPDVVLPVNTSEDLFSCSWKSSNQFIPQTPSSTPVSVRNICLNRRDGINNSFNQRNSKKFKYSLSKCLLKRQIFKKINNSNQFQAKCQMKNLSPSNTIPKTISVPSSPMGPLNRKVQTFIDSSEEILETYTNSRPLFSPRILSQNEFNSPKTTNSIESKEISRCNSCNSLIIPKTMGNIFQIMEQSRESEQFCKSFPESQDLFSPEILSATQDKTKHLFTLQNTNTISIDNPFHSCFKLKPDVNQQQTPSPEVFTETLCDVTCEILDAEVLPEIHGLLNQNSTKVDCKIQNKTHLHQRTPVLCNKTLDIYASPDLFCTQPDDSNVHSHLSEDFCQNVQTLPQSPDIFTSNTSVQSDTPNILPETQPDVDNSIQSPDVYNETETNSCNLLLSTDTFSPTQKSKPKYLLHSIHPLCRTPESTKHYISSPDIIYETQKNTQDRMKSPDIFSQTQEPFFKHKNKYLFSWNQISSPTKITDLQHKDTVCKVSTCSNLASSTDNIL
ncbi:uncharacterized protein LOC106873564 [Octopus bimaculoides]|uniref:Replication factor A C-terminal domain-containing protein n=1 Tax=Octopus bimaculoides TaxID=37653 RepID=A0A0L8H0B9_OCTBM|nr:uncharacterized protein LOC106873564 [Octopus bimaculoides]|eukprot:XP_014776478.1 PREDICTED: uncharacterized protein LOC106873564 [Octopus bimaculoides]